MKTCVKTINPAFYFSQFSQSALIAPRRRGRTLHNWYDNSAGSAGSVVSVGTLTCKGK